jgi:hypothetical protein
LKVSGLWQGHPQDPGGRTGAKHRVYALTNTPKKAYRFQRWDEFGAPRNKVKRRPLLKCHEGRFFNFAVGRTGSKTLVDLV